MQIDLPHKEELRPVSLFWDRLWFSLLPWQRGLFTSTPHSHLSLSLATTCLVASSQNPINPFPPPAETWFGILFVTLVEVAPPRVKTSVLGIFLFMMNNVGGNLPVLLDPLSKLVGYRSVSAAQKKHFDRESQGSATFPLPWNGRLQWPPLPPCHPSSTISPRLT